MKVMYCQRKIKENITSTASISIFFLVILVMILTSTNFVYSLRNQSNYNVTDLQNIREFQARKVRVGDIDIAYKTLGEGEPILLVNPAQADMNTWDPSILENLSSNHTVILFDNRGVGNTTSGNRPFSIQQFTDDTAGLLDSLNIQKADVLGYSLGSFIAQQLTVTQPEKVNRLILLASSCGGKDSIPHSPQVPKMVIDVINKIGNGTPVSADEVKALLSQGLGSGWLKQHPNYLETIPIPEAKDLFPSITPNNNLKQLKAGEDWMATDWSGICDELTKISIPTLVMTGTDDLNVPTSNSLIIAGKIPGAWLIQIKDAGHQLTGQYPDEINEILETFLSITN
ncbi:MAG TPA: alpha/beta hydrolase [Nitrososphaeraceae archaeon]|jgi:pimeloyl-ACP methyl ester carboxylesterase|nr:alpha/beta hydrolase [Nitrososphaeraceae archaeon]